MSTLRQPVAFGDVESVEEETLYPTHKSKLETKGERSRKNQIVEGDSFEPGWNLLRRMFGQERLVAWFQSKFFRSFS